MQAAFDDARERRDAAAIEVERTQERLRAAEEAEAETRGAHERTLARLNEADARMAAVAEQLGRLGAQARAAKAEAERHAVQLEQAHGRMEIDSEELASLTERLAAAQAEPEQFEADTRQAQERRDEDEAAARVARAKETEARHDVNQKATNFKS